MKYLRLFLSFLVIVGYALASWAWGLMRSSMQAESAVLQLQNSATTYGFSRWFGAADRISPILLIVTVLALLLIWAAPLWRMIRRVPKSAAMLLIVSLITLITLTACGPYQVEKSVVVEANESAFVIPLEGDTTQQAQFLSEEFLRANQVAAKRIIIPTRRHKIGRGWGNFEYIDLVKVIKVDRTPVSREWTSNPDTGTSSTNEAINVESLESVNFFVGIVATASIQDQNAARFLSQYSGKTLPEIMDSNVRNFIASELSYRFGKLLLLEAQIQKSDVLVAACEATTKQFAPKGITIESCGGTEGFQYQNPAIQTAIDTNFEAQQAVIRAKAALEAQRLENERIVITAKTQAEATVLKAEADAKALQLKGEMLARYPSLVDYELALRNTGAMPQTLLVPDSKSGDLPFGFFMNQAAPKAEGPVISPTAPVTGTIPAVPTSP